MPHLIYIPFLFVLGACVGSFLNVVVWRLPRGESLITPPSHCPKCNAHLAWYDNVPVFGWIFLKGRCRYCHEPISARYPIIEAITGGLFVFYYVMFFVVKDGFGCSISLARREQLSFTHDWAIYLLYMWLISALLASSLIDAELFIIEPTVVWTTAFIAMCYHGGLDQNRMPGTLSELAPTSAALAAGAAVGWLISGILWFAGKFPVSFPEGEPILEAQREDVEEEMRQAKKRGEDVPPMPPVYTRRQVRREIRKEMLFLMPAMFLGALMMLLTMPGRPLAGAWLQIYHYEWVRGVLGSLLGGMIGGFTVWVFRVIFTYVLGRVAMGRGDADLMFAVGAVLGAGPVVLAFFLAPFFGILMALYIWLFSKYREIPYGPYLSLASAFVMIAYCPIAQHFAPGLQIIGEEISRRIAGA
jgi:leader peptidase (prepilin peptidase)/N-methyltransferase